VPIEDPFDVNALHEIIFEHEWYDVYDLIEFLVQHIGKYREAQLTERVNTMLAMDHGGHRVVDQYVVPVTNAAELVSIENAIASIRNRRTRE
jgi:hypothetical protein